jgi:hypothetical protein
MRHPRSLAKSFNSDGKIDECSSLMGHSQGRTNAKKRAVRRKKTERLALAKKKPKPSK